MQPWDTRVREGTVGQAAGSVRLQISPFPQGVGQGAPPLDRPTPAPGYCSLLSNQ